MICPQCGNEVTNEDHAIDNLDGTSTVTLICDCGAIYTIVEESEFPSIYEDYPVEE